MMQKFRYTVEIEAESADLAERALWERIGPDEDYGFDYTIGLVPASSTTASNTTADSSTTGREQHDLTTAKLLGIDKL